MATIQQLMPYLEQGYIAHDHVRRAYLEPKRQGDAVVFEWKAYEMEGEWSGPDIHTREYVLAWKSDRWGILCRTEPILPGGGISEYDTDKPERIEQAIADGLAYKAKGFREEAPEQE